MPSAGPYYVASYTPGQGAVLKRNPNYRGSRPHALDEIDYSVGIGAAQIVKEIDDGTADFGVVDDLPPRTASRRLAGRYGSRSPAARDGGQRYFVNSLLGLVNLDLNTSRPLFASADLRKAVNYALDRRAIARAYRPLATPTDQYLQPAIPGFRDTHVYPLTRGSRGGTTPRPRPPRPRRPLCLRHARLSRGRTPDPERACADRDQRRDQVEVELLHDLQPHRISRASRSTWPSTSGTPSTPTPPTS